MAKQGKTIQDRQYIVIPRIALEYALRFKGESRQNYLDRLIEYSLDGAIPKDLPPMPDDVALVWPLIEIELNKGIKRYLNGSKGGAPQGNKNHKKKDL